MSASINTSVSTDFTQYERLRADAREGGDEALHEVARRFEGLFIEMMLKSMRDSVQKGGLMESQAGDMYQQMYDRQIADNMSSGRGLGLAEMMVRQLTAQGGTVGAAPIVGAAPRAATGTAGIATRGVAPTPQPTTPAAWLSEVMPHAQAAADDLGVPVEGILAQAALESGWGRSAPSVGNNVFGIKADTRWDGPTVSHNTVEVRDGVAVRERASFRAYDSMAESFQDFVSFLRANPRYQPVLDGAKDVASFAQGLQRAGYATDPEYASKIQRIASNITGMLP